MENVREGSQMPDQVESEPSGQKHNGESQGQAGTSPEDQPSRSASPDADNAHRASVLVRWLRALPAGLAAAVIGGVVIGELKIALGGLPLLAIAILVVTIIYGFVVGEVVRRATGPGKKPAVRYLFQGTAALLTVLGIFLAELEFLIRLSGALLAPNFRTLVTLAIQGATGNTLLLFGSGLAVLVAIARVK